MDLNDEQRKHLSITLRNLGFGALIPVALKIYSSGIDVWLMLIWFMCAFWLEMLALYVLKGVQDDRSNYNFAPHCSYCYMGCFFG